MMKPTQPMIDAVDGLMGLVKLLNTKGLSDVLAEIKSAAETAVTAETVAAMAEQSAKTALAQQVEVEAKARAATAEAQKETEYARAKMTQMHSLQADVRHAEELLAGKKAEHEAAVAAATDKLNRREAAVADGELALKVAQEKLASDRAAFEEKRAKLLSVATE